MIIFLICYLPTIQPCFHQFMLLIAFLAVTMMPCSLLCWLPSPSNLLPIAHCTITRNISDLKEVLFRVPWNTIDFDSNDIELSWSQWKGLFFSAINYVVPTIRWSRRKLKHWFSESTIKLIH